MSNQYEYDYIVFIGRMQPPTIAHIQTIQYALTISKNVIVLFGSSFKARTIKNPWTWEERSKMILNHFSDDRKDRIIFGGLRDCVTDPEWAQQVQHIVNSNLTNLEKFKGRSKIGIIGCKKDHTSYYLNMFPQWEFIETNQVYDLSATDIRNAYFEGTLFKWRDKDLIHYHIVEYLREWLENPNYALLVEEYNQYVAYKKSWELAPYPPIFVTTDAVVIQSGHILLVERKHTPGKGLWALPGGFLNQHEFIKDGMIRELREETKLKVPEPVLKGSIIGSHVFEHPNRSIRGRTITHAFVINLPSGPLSEVKGSDDAEKAKWIPIDDVLKMEELLFEDHYEIIKWGINVFN